MNAFLEYFPHSPLRPHLRRLRLTQQQILLDKGQLSSTVYFPIDAVISLVVPLENGLTIESAMVGRDGVVGALTALDGKVSLVRALTQLDGECLVCDAAVFKRVAMEQPALHSLAIRHEQAVQAQAHQTAACNASHNLERRLAKWLLRARDLRQSNELVLTQQVLAIMLGVGRTSVSITAHLLQERGIIKYARGRLRILQSDKLEALTCECYRAIKESYKTAMDTTAVRETA